MGLTASGGLLDESRVSQWQVAGLGLVEAVG